MSELFSLDRFRAEWRGGGAKPAVALWRLASVSATHPEPAAPRTVQFCLSDSTIDRMGDTIAAAGWQTADYLKNPIVLWAHDAWSPPIGAMRGLRVENGRLLGAVEFIDADLYPFADLIFRMVEGGWLRAGSVGFRPLDFEWSDDPGREFGIDFKTQELLEFSIVPIPANANALVEARAAGLDLRPLSLWAERILDLTGKTMPKTQSDPLRLLARAMPGIRADAAEWRCGAARDLPLDDSEAWDGPAAAASIFEYAGGDDFDPAKARRGFLLYDAANPKLKGSYKDPIARAESGELHAVKGGVRAAASRLPQTDAPAAAKAEAEAVIRHYEEKFGMDGAKSGAKPGVKSAGDAIAGSDPAAGGFAGNCGRASGEECGMKDAAECAVHGPMMDAMRVFGMALRRELAPLMARAGLAGLEQEAMPLAKALDHLRAAHEATKDLIEIDPDGDELGHKMAVMTVHAHVKAADHYLDRHRDLQPPPEGDDAGDAGSEEGDAEARALRLAALAPAD